MNSAKKKPIIIETPIQIKNDEGKLLLPEYDLSKITFIYEGKDDWINLDEPIETIPFEIPDEFVAKLRLEDESIIKALPICRTYIWVWWYNTRKNELIMST